MGSADQMIRIGLAMIIAALYFSHVITGILAAILIIVLGILVVTSLFSFCPLYYPFGFRTNKNAKNHERFANHKHSNKPSED